MVRIGALRIDALWVLVLVGAVAAALLGAPFVEPVQWAAFVGSLTLVGVIPPVALRRQRQSRARRRAAAGTKVQFARALDDDREARGVVVVDIECFAVDAEPDELVAQRVIAQLDDLDGSCFRLDSSRVALLTSLPDRLLGPRLEALRHLLNGALPNAAVAIGYATQSSGETLPLVYARASTAVTQARAAGGVSVHPFDARTSPTPSTLERVTALRELAGDGQMSFVYQPLVNLRDQQVLGYEAYMRPAPRYGLSADDAFSLAEQTGLVAELDQSCLTALASDAPGFDLVGGELLFVNLTPTVLTHERFVLLDFIAQARRAGLKPSQLVIEVSERGSYDPAVLAERLEAARSAGLRIALDNVGAGASGLTLLLANSFDYVKIDRTVIQPAAGGDRRAEGALRAICAFVEQAGSQVIVEGVETVDDWIYLRGLDTKSRGALGIVGAQGYHLGKPAPGIPQARTATTDRDAVGAG